MNQLRLLLDIAPEESFRPVYNAQGQCFLLDEKIDRGSTDTPNPDIHNFTFLPNHSQRPAFRATPTQSRKIVLRPVKQYHATAISVSYEFPIIIILIFG